MSYLELPQTKLSVRHGVLKKKSGDDKVVGDFPLKEITDVRIERIADYPLPVVLVVVFVGLAVVSKTYVPYIGWAWAGAVVCVGVACLSMLMVDGRKIFIETTQGTVGYPVIGDTFDDAEGFVISLKQKLVSLETNEEDGSEVEE